MERIVGNRVTGVDAQAPTSPCDMEEPYRTDQAIRSTRVGPNGSDNEPITKAFHRIAIVAKAYKAASRFGKVVAHVVAESERTLGIPRPRCTEDEYEYLMTDPAKVRIGSIVIHCHEFDRMVRFWCEALGYVPREPPRGGWVVLTDPTLRGPNLSLQARDRRRAGRSWLHLDLYTGERDKEVDRLLTLGAKRYPWRSASPADFVVLEDPDGNLFCVVQKDSGA